VNYIRTHKDNHRIALQRGTEDEEVGGQEGRGAHGRHLQQIL